MSIKNKRGAVAAITERRRVVNGVKYTTYDVYLGINDITRKPVRLYAPTRTEMMEKIDEFYACRAECGDFATVLSAEQIVDARTAIRRLEEAGIDMTLSECVQREIARQAMISVQNKPIGEAYEEYLSRKKPGYDLNKTRQMVGKWVEFAGADRLLTSVTLQELRAYIREKYDDKSAKTYNSAVQYIVTFLNWCMAEGQRYIAENPAKKIEQKAEEWKEPEYLTTEDAKKLILALWDARNERPDCMALCVNGLMMGIRREESVRMANDPTAITVNLEDETVRVAKPKGFQKGIMPRSFQMPEMALAWARAFDYAAGVAKISDYTMEAIADISKKIGVALPHNAFRHTFITKHVAAFGDPAKTQAIVGTSAKMRANNYCGLDSRKEGEAFFAITPPGA